MLKKNIDKQNRKHRKNWVGLYCRVEKNKKAYNRKNKYKDELITNGNDC